MERLNKMNRGVAIDACGSGIEKDVILSRSEQFGSEEMSLLIVDQEQR